MEIIPQHITEILKQRESTFFNGLKEGGKIPDSTIKEIIEHAIWAPTHGLVQAWRFVVYAQGGVQTFLKQQAEIYRQITPVEKFREEKYKKYQEKSKYVSHIVAVICQRDKNKRFPKLEDIVSTACVVQNIYLMLKPFGIAGYLSTGDICYSAPMRNYLNLAPDDECLGFFQLGIAKEDKPNRIRRRTKANEKTIWLTE